MKKARDNQPICPLPKGVYESGRINEEIRKNKNNSFQAKATDSQGNGYPVSQNKKS